MKTATLMIDGMHSNGCVNTNKALVEKETGFCGDQATSHEYPRKMSVDPERVDDAMSRGLEIEFIVDGHPVRAFQGESVAVALIAAGKRVLRRTAQQSEPRGVYCGVGICFDCVITIDGQPNVRACQTKVRAGMRIETQSGNGTWCVKP